MTSGSPWHWRRRRLECWNIGPSVISPFLLPRRLQRLNLCQGPEIAPCLWKNPRLPTTSSPMILWGILRPKPHLRYRTGSETAAVPKICRSNMNFCKIHWLNTFDSLAQKCGCVRTLQCCGRI